MIQDKTKPASSELSKDPSIETGTQIEKPRKEAPHVRRLLFEYPELPKLEILFYFLVTCCSIVYAWSRIYVASRKYIWNLNGVWESYENVQWPYMGKYRRDSTDGEWNMWKMWAFRILPWLLGHSILFNIGEIFLPNRVWSILMLIYWLTAHITAAGKMIMAVALLAGFTIYTFARLTKSKIISWLIGVTFLYWSTATDYLVDLDEVGLGYYIVVVIFPYKTLQFLTYITEMIEERKRRDSNEKASENSNFKWADSFVVGLYKMYWYSMYLPYSCHLIVIYKRFPQQLELRKSKIPKWSEVIIFGLRITFWAFLTEFLGYVFYFEAMMQNWQYLRTVTEDTLVSIGYATGQFFHLKYVVIFGMGAFFAKLDKMEPFNGPICIARIALYAKVWRCFDRGLYDFFKEYIFLPVCRPTFSISRKILGVFVSYAFVIIWHGTTHQYIVWVILNICELFQETIAKVLYTVPIIRELREKHISDRNFRRILAWLQIVTFAFGLYSNFYFLGSSESGYVFVDRIFWQETVPVRWPFLLLICLGYCYCHVCMEVDRRQGVRARRLEEIKKNE